MAEDGALHSIASNFTGAMYRASNTGVQIQEIAHLTLIRIDVDPFSAAALRIQQVLGAGFPQEPGEVTGDTRALEILYGTRQIVACLWAGEDSFLVMTHVDGIKLGRALNTALGSDEGLVLDVSANRSVIELSGPQAPQVLARTVSFESAPEHFDEGTALRCRVGEAQMMLWRIGAYQYLMLPRSAHTAPFLVAMLDAIADIGENTEQN